MDCRYEIICPRCGTLQWVITARKNYTKAQCNHCGAGIAVSMNKYSGVAREIVDVNILGTIKMYKKTIYDSGTCCTNCLVELKTITGNICKSKEVALSSEVGNTMKRLAKELIVRADEAYEAYRYKLLE